MHSSPNDHSLERAGGAVFVDERSQFVNATTEAVFEAACRVGGERGWFGTGWLWSIRGVLDKIVGGPGMRRGRRDPHSVRVGDPIDFWRVEAVEPGHLLRLRAEMRLPGVASLEWRIEPAPRSEHGPRSRLYQTLTFAPRSLWGRAYWHAVSPLHRFFFPELLRGLAADAEAAT